MAGCLGSHPAEVVVYTALDREFSAPIFAEFTQQTGIRVLAKYDAESTKTVGLTNAIIAEAARPRCDVFWNNEILNTIRLERRGLLAAFQPANAEQIPEEYRSPNGRWYGFACRARVLLINTKLIPEAERPTSIRELASPRWKDRVGIAKPLFGTTATHAALLFASWPQDEAEEFWRRALGNARIMSGNKQVARAVASGQLAWGLTDTDDAIIEHDAGFPVEIVFPDQAVNGLGTPLIPNTVCLLSGSPHPAAARRLADYLLSPQVEAKLARGRSAQIPLLRNTSTASRLEIPLPLKTFTVDFSDAADQWNAAAAFMRANVAGE
jgi:iron(III) transport system substrate-binding protein